MYIQRNLIQLITRCEICRTSLSLHIFLQKEKDLPQFPLSQSDELNHEKKFQNSQVARRSQGDHGWCFSEKTLETLFLYPQNTFRSRDEL